MVDAKAAALAAALFAGLAGQAIAQDADADYRRNCTADYQRLCSAYFPGSPEVEQCFRSRMKEVSQRCRDTIAKYSGTPRRGR